MIKRIGLIGIVILTAAGLIWAFAWQQSAQAQNAISEVSVEHTGCYGTCPVYKVTLRRDGSATFIGSRYVEKIGTYKAQFGGFDHLTKALEQRDYWRFKSRYAYPITDQSTTITTVVQSGRRKTVEDYADAGPQKLWEIETLIDGAVAEVHWKKVNNSTAYP